MKKTVLVLSLCLLALSGCIFSSSATPAPAPIPAANLLQTIVAQTLTAQPTTSSPTITDTPVASATFPADTPTLSLPTPTGTPVYSLTPTPTTYVAPAQVYPAPSQSPAQFVRYYYSQINISNYPVTWSLLTASFQSANNGPATGGYQGYVDFWNTVHEVTVEGVSVLSQTNYYAVVNVTARYHWNSGSITFNTDTFDLLYNYSRGTWMFDSPTSYYVPPVTPYQTPSQFIVYYYSQINLSNYPLTWSLLDTNFQNNVNGPDTGGYAGYVAYWNTVNSVSVQSVTVLSQTSYYATVRVYAIYYYNNGTTVGSTDSFNLVYDYSRATWLFDSPY